MPEKTVLTIKKGTVSISDYAFYNQDNLVKVIISEGVESIGSYAFGYCYNLENAVIPESITHIGEDPFWNTNCTGLYETDSDGMIYFGKVLYGFDDEKVAENAAIKLREDTVEIRDGALQNCSKIVSVEIPDTVVKIGYRSFDSCSSLTSVSVPEKVEKINACAFANCTNLKKVVFNTTLKEISSGAFENCTALTSVDIPDSVIRLGSGAFSGCISLENVKLPESITEIPSSLFEYCENLKSVIIPYGVTAIDGNAFSDCTALSSITVPETVNDIGRNVFNGDSLSELVFADGTKKVTRGMTWGIVHCVQNVVIPETVEVIGDYAFEGADNLKEITILDNVKEIGAGAFQDCNNLSEVVLPDGITKISEQMFYSCGNLETVSIPDTVVSIENRAFSDCLLLKGIALPDNITAIGEYAFSYCSSLENIKLPKNLLKISEGLFDSCEKLVSVDIPAGVKEIDEYAFSGCSLLKEITIPDSIEQMSYYSFDESLEKLIISDGSVKVTSAMTNGVRRWIKEVVIPDTVTSIGDEAFAYSDNLVSVTLLSDDVEFGSYVFQYCDALESIEFMSGMKMIGLGMFMHCSSLKDLVIPEGVIEIGEDAFYSCENIKSVSIPESLNMIGDGAFGNCSSLTEITIPDNVEVLGNLAFEGCGKLEKATLPPGITFISDGLFLYCDSLRTVVIPDTVKNIENEAFYYCTSLSQITIPAGIETISYDAFWNTGVKTVRFKEGMQKLTRPLVIPFIDSAEKVILPGTITEMEEGTFSNFDCLKSISLPSGLKEIPNNLFSSCDSITEVDIPENVSVIGEGAFEDCINLHTVTLPDSITVIPDFAFCQNKNLVSVTASDKLESIGEYAFAHCEKLSSINSKNESILFKSNSFVDCYSLNDSRFMIIEKDSVNFSSNADSINVDGIVNFTLKYAFNKEMAKNASDFKIKINVPNGMLLIDESVSCTDENSTVEYDSPLYVGVNNSSGTIKFSARILEYGEYDVGASVEFLYNDEYWNQPIANLKVSAPKIIMSTPFATNTRTIEVSGMTDKGQEVSIYVDNEFAGTVMSNSYTGKFKAKVILPEKEDADTYRIYGSTSDGYSSAPITVTYSPEKPMVESVYMRYNGNNSVDITNIFTEGATPYFSINPSYPFEFEVKTSYPDKIRALYVTSTKGRDKKFVEAYYSIERQAWIASGFFDPDNRNYVPGTLNISIYEMEPNIIDLSKPDEIQSDYKEMSDNIPENVKKNSKYEIIANEENSFAATGTLADGNGYEKEYTVFTNSSNYIYIDDVKVSGQEIIKAPEKYGFVKSPDVIREPDGKEYIYYAKPILGDDAKKQIQDTAASNNKKSPIIAITEAVDFFASGEAIVKVPAELIRKGSSKSIPVEIGSILVSSALDTAADITSDSFDDLVKRVPQLTEFANTDMCKTLKGSGKIGQAAQFYSNLGDAFDVIDTAGKSYQFGERVGKSIAKGDVGSLCASTAVFGGQMLTTWGGDAFVGACTSFGAGVGGPIGAAIGFVGGHIALGVADYFLDKWGEAIDDRLNDNAQYKDGGSMKIGIDPSGIVYEAVESNRLEGATMTIYYKDNDTGDEILWNAEDYYQINPLKTDQNGAYAWDVPEGIWRVKFEMDGYETSYSEWMDVPPERTGINFSAVSYETPVMTNAVAADGVITVTFSKYMDISTVTSDTLILSDDEGNILDTVIKPVKNNSKDIYACKFNLTVSGENDYSALNVISTDGCTSYSGTSAEAKKMSIEIPDKIISMTTDREIVTGSKSSTTKVTVTAYPAGIASGKKLIVTDKKGVSSASGEVVFDKNGKAVINLDFIDTGISDVVISVEGQEITAEFTVVSLFQYNEETVIAGDVDGNGTVNVKDSVMISRYLAGGWDSVEINERAADVNGDGKLNVADAILIRRYLAGGWDTELKVA